MSEHYSPERRTALVLTGTGADGAYHAGVLRALNETGIKIDLVCGRGIGAAGALFAAIDGASRLFDPKGLWRGPAVARLYSWRWSVRVLFTLVAVLIGVLVSPIVFLTLGFIVYLAGLLLGMAGLELGAALLRQYADLLVAAFAPTALPTWLPRLIAVVVIAALAVLIIGNAVRLRSSATRRSRGTPAWGLVSAPIDSGGAHAHFMGGLWDLLKGGANLRTPAPEDLSRRFSELLNDNLGQPGFSELLIAVHDLDARRDLVFGLVREPFRRALFPAGAATGAAGSGAAAAVPRRSDAFDLSGVARDHLLTVLRAALNPPEMTEPALITFAADGYWRGESHRLVDRPASVGRLLEEAAAAGAEQVILVTASPQPSLPHELARPRLDPMGRLSDRAAALESSAVRDAVQHLQHRFRAVYQIRPLHNPVGAFDLAGSYDERSDRQQTLAELMERGYEDAYRGFIDAIVAPSGEHLRTKTPT
jgi:hypothetical protein